MGTRKITGRQLQELEIGLLEKFSSYCQKNKLVYCLAGGTLLGAVRHKGFIPWDDDIDVCMPRPDYMKLIECVQEEQIADFIAVDSRYLDSACPSSIIRIYDNRTKIKFDNFTAPYEIGAWIDIFPLDGVPKNQLLRKIHFAKMRIAMDFFIISTTKFGGKRRNAIATALQFLAFPLWPLTRLLGYKKILSYIDRLARKYSIFESEYIACIEGRAGEKETMPKKEFLDRRPAPFDRYSFMIPSNYDYYLTRLYGDYMIPPSEKERKSRHEIDVRWR